MCRMYGNVIAFFLSLICFLSCSKENYVNVRGQILHGDGLVSIWVGDSIFEFRLDESGFFSGKIPVDKETYASIMPYSINLYLYPGRLLEIRMNTQNIPGTLNFSGGLGAVNNYLKEQEIVDFFDKNYYSLDESVFIDKMYQIIDEKINLLKAKNFEKSFTDLEIQRIGYSVAEKALLYPLVKKEDGKNTEIINNFIKNFSINRKDLFGSVEYRRFLLNYVKLYGFRKESALNPTDDIADFIVSSIDNPQIRDFLLTAVIWQHITTHSGIRGAGHILDVFFRLSNDSAKIVMVSDWVKRWSNLLPGKPAPDFEVSDMKGKRLKLSDFKGHYLYIMVWASWCLPCKKELPYMASISDEYGGRNIRFMTISIDARNNLEAWRNFMKGRCPSAIHTVADEYGRFSEDYQIFSIPRFILISPVGKIVNSNALRPSVGLREFLEELNM